MKILKPVWILSLILFCAPTLRAQWAIDVTELTQHLDSVCAGSGHPLADGTEIRLYHDWNSNGPDNADTLLRLCDDPPACDLGPAGSVNYNVFWINGANEPGCMASYPGGFSTICPPLETAIVNNGEPPNPNRVYLRVCFPGRHYDSEILSPSNGYSEIEIGSWTCVEASCPGCETPPSPENFRASDSTYCDSVRLSWRFSSPLDADVDSVFLYRGLTLLGRVRASQADTVFFDTTVPDAAQYSYSAKSRRACVSGDTAYSPVVFDFGAKFPSPPNITFGTGAWIATDDSCNMVRVSWTYGTNVGVDSFIIRRNGVRVGAMVKRTPTPGVMTYYHVTTDSTRGGYKVCGKSVVCGEGNCSIVDSGRAAQPPANAPTGINATDGNCGTTTVTWDSVGGVVTYYKVYRYNNDGTTETYLGEVPVPTRTYNDASSSAGTTFRYKVRAKNSCGDGPLPTAYDTGYRVTTPVTVTGVSATDSTSCDAVTVTWTNNNTMETGYKVYRTPAAGGTTDTLSLTVPADDTQFLDVTATPGVLYNYGVRAFNACGNGPTSTTNQGSRKAPPGKPGSVTASDGTNCTGVVISWPNVAREDSFTIFRNGERIGRTGRDTLTFTDLTADTFNTRYGYSIRACGMCGCSTSVVDSGYRRTRPGLATGLAATDTRCDSIRLTWNTLTNTDSFRIIRNGVYLTRVAGGITAYNDLATVGATYGYRILPVNLCGLGDTSVVDSGTRKAPPPAVATVTASDTVCGGVQVTWTNVAGEDSFQIRRDTTRIGMVLTDVLNYTDNTAVPGTRYRYEVRPYNACGFTSPATSDSGTGHATPVQVANVLATDSTECWGVRITWNDTTDVDSFIVKRAGSRIGAKPAHVLSFNDSTAERGTIYSYTVLAKNVCGEGSVSTANEGSRKRLPGQVTGLDATDIRCDSIRLTWNALAYTDSFRVLRNGSVIQSVSGATISYNDRPPAGTYAYRILPWNVCGNGDTSAVDSGTRLAQPPTVGSITATDSGCSGVLVSWTDVAGEDSFMVKRDGDTLAVLPADTVTYFDTTAVAGARYLYEVAAYNACGAADPVVSDSGGRRAVPGAVPSLGASSNDCDQVLVTWGTVANVDTYYVYRNAAPLAAVAPPDTFYADTTATPGQNYSYIVQTWNACGFGPPGEVGGMRLVFPSVPQNLAATQDLCDRIRVTWDAAVDTAEDVDSYRLIRDGTDSVTVSKDSTGYNDIANPGQHSYVIKAVSSECGASAASAQAGGERLVPAGVPANVQATNIRCDSVVITWDAAPGDVDGYILYESGTPLDTVGPDILRYAYQPGLGGGYVYTVRAFSNECGWGNLSNADSGARLQYPTTVTGLSATVNRCDSVRLQWNQASGTFDGYIVRRDTTVLDTVNVLYYVDAPPVGSAQYDVITYSVYCDDSDPTAPVAGTRLPAPVSPDTVDATDDLCDSVVVTWNAGTGTFDGYYLYRNHVRLTTLPAGTQRYAEAPTSGVTYTYAVTAWDSICGEAAVLDSAQGMRQADASVPQNLTAVGTCEAVVARWNTATGAVAEYRIYRDATLRATVLPPDTFYADTSAVRGVTYTYAVSAFSTGCGETALSSSSQGMRLPLPVQVTGLTASNNNCAGIFIEWAAMTGTEWYRVYRDNSLIDSVSGGLRTTSYLDINVVPRSTHHYQVNSVNICGQGARSDSAAGTRYDVPDAVNGFSASDSSCVAIYLIWRDVATETGYVIYRDTSPIDTVSANDTAYVDTAATPGAHVYVVKALNECGLSGPSEGADALRIPGVAQVTGVAATSGLCDRIDVTWTDLTNEEGYVVWRGTTRIDTLDANVTTFSDLVAPGTYTYQITAFNVCGEGLISAVASGFRAWVPPQVMNVVATQDSCTSVTITWTDVATEQFYQILRNDALIDTVDSNITSYVNQPLAPGNYIYQVRAGNYCGNGLASSTANGRVADVPAQVTGVAATNNGCTTITVTWTDLTDELQYQILRNDTLVGTVARDTLRYVDATPAIGTHSYKVRGLNVCGQGALSAPVTGERQGPPTVQPQLAAQDSVCGQVTVYWLTVPDAINYTVFVDGDSAICTADTFFVVIANPGPHAITVKPWNECGYGQISAPKNVFFRSTVPQVTGLTADTMNCLTITLHWTDVANDTGYAVLRGADSIGHVGANVTTYVDSPTNPGTYLYQVKAINQCGYGSPSNPATGRRRGPPAVTTVTASDTFCTQIVVSWTNVADELGYYVFQNGAPVDTVGRDTLSVILTPPPGAYAYTVQPFNDCGLANMSAVDSGHRLTIPPRVTGVAATVNRCDSVIVTWSDVAGETRYVIFRDDDSLAQVNADVTRFADAPVVGVHEYKVRADNQCGNGLLSDSVMGERLISPLAPIDVAATDSLCGQIRVTWLSGGGDVDSFKVYRNDTLVVTVPAAVLTHIEGAIGTHAYHVIAKSNECGNSPASVTDSGTGHNTADVPTGLTFVQPEVCDIIRLTWTASTGEVEGYRIRRDGVVIDSVDTVQYADTIVDDPREHVYAVAAYNTFCGSSAFTENVAGSMLSLAAMAAQPDDTLYCRDTVSMAMTFCLPIDSVVAYLSVNGGPYSTRIGSGVPTQSPDTTAVIIPPIPDQIITPNCRVRIISYRSGRVDTLDTDPFVIHCDLAAGENLSEIPKDFFLDQNYPNPFNPATNIRFGVPRVADVTIEIFDILGRKMTTLVSGQMQPGIHTVTWDCSGCPSGMYIIRMNTGERVLLRKTLLMK